MSRGKVFAGEMGQRLRREIAVDDFQAGRCLVQSLHRREGAEVDMGNIDAYVWQNALRRCPSRAFENRA